MVRINMARTLTTIDVRHVPSTHFSTTAAKKREGEGAHRLVSRLSIVSRVRRPMYGVSVSSLRRLAARFSLSNRSRKETTDDER